MKFGEVSQFLGYNAFTDFFPQYPLIPNPECTDRKCVERQKYYREHEEERRITEKKEEGKEEVKHVENEWGIIIEGGEDQQE